MIANQFLARAYLCQFELLAPRNTTELVRISFLSLAFDFIYEYL